MSKCLDCGCGMESGICSNCHEELFISTFQADDAPDGFSKDFIEKASEQQDQIKARDKMIREDPEVFKDLESTDTYYKKVSV